LILKGRQEEAIDHAAASSTGLHIRPLLGFAFFGSS
jgi:hypothetical protein